MSWTVTWIWVLILLEPAMKAVAMVLEESLRKIAAIDDMQFGIKPGKGTIDAVFILRRIQEEYIANWKKLHMCFVDQEKAFDRDLRKVVEWAIRRKGIPEALVRAVMSLYKGAHTNVKVVAHYLKSLCKRWSKSGIISITTVVCHCIQWSYKIEMRVFYKKYYTRMM